MDVSVVVDNQYLLPFEEDQLKLPLTIRIEYYDPGINVSWATIEELCRS